MKTVANSSRINTTSILRFAPVTLGVLVCSLLIPTFLGCSRRDYSAPTRLAFVAGDFDNVIKLGTKWSKNSTADPLPKYLLSFAFFVKGDAENARKHRELALHDTAKLEGLKSAMDSYVAQSTESVWAHLALATILEVQNEPVKALTNYEKAAALSSTNAYVSRCWETARLANQQQKLGFAFEALPKGKMQPLKGEWGRARPLESEFSVEGKAETTLIETKLLAQIQGWGHLYSDAGGQTSVGWGLRVVSGSFLLSSNDFHAITSRKTFYHVPMTFEISPFDYLGSFVRIDVMPERNQFFIIPVGFYDESNLVPEVTLNLQGNLYRKDKSSTIPVGVYINSEGKRVALNPHHVIFQLNDGATIKGTRCTVVSALILK